MATTTVDPRQGINPTTPRAERNEPLPTSTAASQTQSKPMSQQSINKALSWVAGIAVALAVIALAMAMKANKTSADVSSDLSSKADKSEIANYGTKSNNPTATDGSSNTMRNTDQGNSGSAPNAMSGGVSGNTTNPDSTMNTNSGQPNNMNGGAASNPNSIQNHGQNNGHQNGSGNSQTSPPSNGAQ